jgi:hypothetical protein
MARLSPKYGTPRGSLHRGPGLRPLSSTRLYHSPFSLFCLRPTARKSARERHSERTRAHESAILSARERTRAPFCRDVPAELTSDSVRSSEVTGRLTRTGLSSLPAAAKLFDRAPSAMTPKMTVDIGKASQGHAGRGCPGRRARPGPLLVARRRFVLAKVFRGQEEAGFSGTGRRSRERGHRPSAGDPRAGARARGGKLGKYRGQRATGRGATADCR